LQRKTHRELLRPALHKRRVGSSTHSSPSPSKKRRKNELRRQPCSGNARFY
jgi:hypothetical protein